MKLENVVPWGRSLEEYKLMFNLTSDDLNKYILGCGDGPASFNAEVTSLGAKIVSADPIYQFSATQIAQRLEEVYQQVVDHMNATHEKYIWSHIRDVEHLCSIRMKAMNKFLVDYQMAGSKSRYIHGMLPNLPFTDKQFDIALCSHFLFLYSDQVSLNQHLEGMRELCRVAKEVRVYPLVALDGKISTHLAAVVKDLTSAGMSAELRPVSYTFQQGAIEMLVVNSCN